MIGGYDILSIQYGGPKQLLYKDDSVDRSYRKKIMTYYLNVFYRTDPYHDRARKVFR